MSAVVMRANIAPSTQSVPRTMERFHVIEDAAVILRNKGTYSQVKVYRRGDDLYAGVGSNFIGLRAHGSTSHPNISWVDIDVLGEISEPVIGLIQLKGASIAVIGAPN